MPGAWSNDQTNELIIYDENGNPSIVLSGSADDFVQIRNANGDTVASIDNAGNASFQSVNITGDLVVGGGNLYDDLLPLSAKGVIAAGWTTANSTATVDATEIGLFELDCILEDQRNYRIKTNEMIIKGTVLNDQFSTRLRSATGASPTTSSNQFAISTASIYSINTDRPNTRIIHNFACDSTSTADNKAIFAPGDTRFLITLARLTGTGTAFISTNTGTYDAIGLWLEDLGPLVQNTLVTNTGGGGTTPVTTYTKTYACTWSGSYLSTGAYTVGGGATRAYQGDDNAGDGNRKSMLGFPFATIASDLSGATITSIKLTAYFRHWWYAAGGTAVIGTHNSSASSHPATFSGTTNRVQSSGWPNPGTKTVSLGTTIGNEFKAGTAKGIVLGPGPSTSTTYYGYADGFGATNPPTLTIVYTK
jgi:hypothetical protein